MVKATPKFRHLLHIATLFSMALGGCSQSASQPVALKLPPPKPRRVEFANLTARTAAVDSAPAVMPEEFLARIQALQQTQASPARIGRLVQRFPDAALEVLRNTSPAQASQPARIATAIAYDRAFVADGAMGWTRVLSESVVHPREYELFQQARLQALQFIEMGRPERAVADKSLSGESIAPFGKAELLRVQGIAALLCDQPAEAQHLWQSAIEHAGADRSVCSELHLLISDGLRHRGLSAAADAEWSSAASLAAGIHDPSLWQRLSEARTDDTHWPPNVRVVFESPADLAQRAEAAQVEPAIWRQIGEWRLARGEAPSALLAFKQSESLYIAPRDRAESRIAEARTLLIMNQSGAAVSILTSLAVDRDPLVSHHAMAVLGNARIALDDIPGALSLLTRAVADDDIFPTSIRATARADLGLVCLMSSQEQEGLTWLHRAQADFERDRNNADLFQCLCNEAIYLDKMGRTDEATMIRNRALRIASLP